MSPAYVRMVRTLFLVVLISLAVHVCATTAQTPPAPQPPASGDSDGTPAAQAAASAAPPAQPEKISRFLSNSYVGFEAGSIGYAFSNAQVQPGSQAQSVQIPHLAARVVLFGHEFNKYFSVQITEMRPVQWVEYRNVNGATGSNSVWMNIAGLTAKARLPLRGEFGMIGEGGLGLVTRKGFQIGPSPVVTNATYATFLVAGGLDYRLNKNWDLLAGVTLAPGNAAVKQSDTVFLSGGFN
jgi:hypothetical protein